MVKSLAAAAFVSAIALAGCGGSGSSTTTTVAKKQASAFDVARSALATAAKGSARVTLDTNVDGLGLPVPVSLHAAGVTSLTRPEGELTFDLGPILSELGSLAGSTSGGSALDLRFTGGQAYAKPPKLEALPVPGGRRWISLDVPKLATSLKLPSSGLGTFFTLDPSAMLRALKAARGMKQSGKETIDGVATTRYTGTYSVADVVKVLPEAERASARKALAKLETFAGKENVEQAIPVDVWVDGQGVLRRLHLTTLVPSAGGQSPSSGIDQTYELSDFGVKLDVPAPAEKDTYDATKGIGGFLGSLATKGG